MPTLIPLFVAGVACYKPTKDLKGCQTMTHPFLYSKILVVDDEIDVCSTLKEFLAGEQFTVETANDGEVALSKMDEFKPQCVLLDIRMPYLGGLDVLKMIKLRQPDAEVIMVTAATNIKIAEECMQNGAFGFITKPVDLNYLHMEVLNALQHRKDALEKQKPAKEELDHLQEEAKKNKSMIHLLNEELFTSLKFPIDLVEYADSGFACHSKNVSWLAKSIAEQMKLEHVRLCELAGLYHDIGKLCLPAFGGKSEKWSDAERDVYEKFPVYGQDIVQSHSHLAGLGTAIRHQCENPDGTGFPDGVAGADIPIESKVIAVANAFDEALIAMNIRNIEQDISLGGKALTSLVSNKKFDLAIVEALSRLVNTRERKKEVEINRMSDLKPKMVLSRNILAKSGKVVFCHQTILTPARIEKINDFSQIDSISRPIYIYA